LDSREEIANSAWRREKGEEGKQEGALRDIKGKKSKGGYFSRAGGKRAAKAGETKTNRGWPSELHLDQE